MADEDEVNLISQNAVDEEEEILTESPVRKQPVASLKKVHRYLDRCRKTIVLIFYVATCRIFIRVF